MYNVIFFSRNLERPTSWTSYPSKEAFEEDRASWTEERKKKDEIFKVGVSDEECRKVMNKIPDVPFTREQLNVR